MMTKIINETDFVCAALLRQRTAFRYKIFSQFGLLLALAIFLPMLSNAYWIKTFTSSFTVAIAVLGVAMLYAQLGLVSLCQYALVGVGGWVALRLGFAYAWPFELIILLSGCAAALTGVLAGLPALRHRGLYLALISLMLAGGYQVVATAHGFPAGDEGLLGQAGAMGRRNFERPAWLQNDAAYLSYVIGWFALILGLLLVHRTSFPGRAWALIRRGDACATSSGVNILFYQSWAFGLAGFCAGVSGALLAAGIGQLDGRSFAAPESIMMFALTVVGGAYHWLGALITGLLLRAAPALLTDWEVNSYLATIFFGCALWHALITAPMGIAGQISELLTLFKAKLFKKNPAWSQHATD